MTPFILISVTAATLFVIAFVVSFFMVPRGQNRSWSFSFALGVVVGGAGAVAAAGASLLLPLTTTKLEEVARSENKCVVQYLSAQPGELRQITLRNAQEYCADLDARKKQEAALTGAAQ
ncbi:hypothetical protein [Brucella cytisi]|uniref:Uncharacterized protein n=1 Tax=Brucella cytisi TaxID=407152 RepID=A0A1J6HAS2_9HYPH|nr:hypothetical protein [Brucella cytisi]OIS90212.1 hypothetical protein BLA27_27985 [Brucella cytisi]